MSYVDGFLLAVPKKNIEAYRRLAQKASKIWRGYGALDYKECVGDDLKVKPGMGISFMRPMKIKSSETVVFSYIVYRSRSHRDAVNKKIMNDPKLKEMCDPKKMPFDMKRMCYGGFKVLVDGNQ